MSNERVKPLFEDASASPEMRNFITMARSDGPTQGELDKLAKRLGPVLGVSAGLVIASQAAAFGSAPSGVLPGLVSSVSAGVGTGAVGASSVGAGLTGAAVPAAAKGGLVSALLASTSAKLVAVGLSVGVAGVGAWQLQGTEPTAARSEQSAAAPAPSVGRPNASKAITAAPVQAEAAPRQIASGQAASDQAPPEQPSAPATLPGAGARALPSAAIRAGVDAPAPRREVRSPSVIPAAVVETGLAQQPAAQVTPSEPAAPVQMVPQPSELSLVRGAQAAARAGSAEALGLIAQHEQLYPHGALAQEREVLAIELLLRAGHTAEASTRARRFELTYTGSAHLARLRALLERTGAK